ncbi:hypothetical protein NLX83_13850 [Allokutzneria sp. A3M-2-11 16]|uniref:hypothetical protein n=1 Tax=Allokutzneria sp. A3M-2-11 16 TaxID=2962043 RepID=UPI0020B6B576|nr:hypothetical protein [Allokutzneria sp. A3M-2-11 16]MCP3800343.1 hypothetical protein [Allokutzneria sp. A3M-2-11 16]
MSRIRSIKPSFFKSDAVAVLPLRARMTWIGLWTYADDHGRAREHARLIHAELYPLDDDVTVENVAEDLDMLATAGRIQRYEVDGKRYFVVTNWTEHQHPNRPNKPRCPAPPSPEHIHTPVDNTPVVHSEQAQCGRTASALPEGEGEVGEGTRGWETRERAQERPGRRAEPRSGHRTGPPSARPRTPHPAPPSSPRARCPRHAALPADDPGPACVGCRDARVAAEARCREERAAAEQRSQRCSDCRGEGWVLDGFGVPLEPARHCKHQGVTVGAAQ